MSDRFTFDGLTYPRDGSVLDGINLSVGTSERVVIFGPNGAGKTTLLRLVAGTAVGSSARADCAYLPQTPYLFRGSARKNLLLGRDDPDRAVAAAGVLGVEDRLDDSSARLSGGERQRVALARVLCGDEPLVLLDEPLGAIDARDRASVTGVIRELTTGRAVLLVTHEVDTAAALADTMVVMDRGRIVQRGTVPSVLAMPADESVAAMVGISNILHGRVVSRVGPLAHVEVGATVMVVVTDAEPSRPVVLKVDASSISVYAAPPSVASHRNVYRGVVSGIVSRGPLLEVSMVGEIDLAALLTQGALDALDLSVGADVWFGVKTAAIGVVGVG